MKKVFYFLSFLSAFVSADVFACRFIPDTRPLSERLSGEGPIFLGIVREVSDEKTTFEVISPIKGNLSSTYEINNKGHSSSCDIRFSKDEVWLYAGSLVMAPSRLLGKTSDKNDTKIGILQKSDDKKLNLNKKLQSCSENSQCVSVNYGCNNTTAINKSYYNEGKDKVFLSGGNPQALNCVGGSVPLLSLPLCIEKTCAQWEILDKK